MSRRIFAKIASIGLVAGAVVLPALARGPDNTRKHEGTIKAAVALDPALFQRQM